MVVELSIALWAPISGLLYALICLLVGERFPFSEYDLYGSAAGRSKGAVPIFLADGLETPISRFERFTGMEPAEMYPLGFPCSLEWIIREAQRWIEEHPAEEGEAAGPHRVEWGFRIIQIDEGKTFSENIEIVQQGWAWPRT